MRSGGCDEPPGERAQSRICCSMPPILSTGTRGATRRSPSARARGQADLSVDRLLDVPLVPRDGARVVRECRRSRELLNRDFVSIKVDREERPDVDRVYMSFVQATTGSGGWPMTRVPDAGAEAVLRRHLFSARVALGTPGFRRSARRARAGVEGRSAARVEDAATRADAAAEVDGRHRRRRARRV